MKKLSKSNLAMLIVIALLIISLSFCICIIYNISSSECYIVDYDECICYNGELYYKICEENRELFSNEFYNTYKDYVVININDLDERTESITAVNPNIRFLTDRVRIVYNNSNHDEIVFLSLNHFLETNYYAKIS